MSMVAATHQITSSSSSSQGYFVLSVNGTEVFINNPYQDELYWTMGEPSTPSYPPYLAGTIWQELDYSSSLDILEQYTNSSSIVNIGQTWGIGYDFLGEYTFTLKEIGGFSSPGGGSIVAESSLECLDYCIQNPGDSLYILPHYSVSNNWGSNVRGYGGQANILGEVYQIKFECPVLQLTFSG